MLKIATICTVLLTAAPAWAGCDRETIDRVSPSGNIIRLQNGNQYETYDPSASTWNEGDDVLICNDDTMINKDDNREKVDVTPNYGSMHEDDDDDQ